MNFQDIVDNNNRQLKELECINGFIGQVQTANTQVNDIDNFLFTNCYKGNVNNIVGLLQNMYMNIFRERLIEIDGYELGENINKIKKIYENPVINSYLDNIKESYKELIRIKKIKSVDEVVSNFRKCKQVLNNILEQYENIKILIKYVNSINIDLSKGIEDVPLRIRTFNEEITEDSINCLIVPIRKIYDELGYIFKINTSEEPIDIVRIESGTFEALFNGNTVLCTILGFVLPKLYDLFIKKYTNSGKKISLKESMNLLLKENEVSEKFKENGIDTKEIDESMLKKMILINKQSEILFLAHPDIKINKKIIKRSEETEKLLGNPVYRIEAKINSDEISDEEDINIS